MNIRRKLMTVCTILIGTAAGYAQNPVQQRIKTIKVTFITEQLNLTPGEAQIFWPIYNEHEEQRETFRKREKREFKTQLKTLDSMTPEAASALLNVWLVLEKEQHEAEQYFIARISDIITPQKTLRLLEAEKEFKKRLLQQYRKRRNAE